MKRASDLECLDAAARYASKQSLASWTRHSVGGDIATGVSLIDAALVRGLREWRALGDGSLLVEQGRIAERALPLLGREARRRLGL